MMRRDERNLAGRQIGGVRGKREMNCRHYSVGNKQTYELIVGRQVKTFLQWRLLDVDVGQHRRLSDSKHCQRHQLP